VWDHVHTALSPQGDELSPRGSWGICAPVLPEGLTVDKVLLKKPGKHLRKLEAPRTGPHTVTAIYTNGTVCIQKSKVNERVNIIRLFPYFEDADH
jgi:hypothetical protein